MRLQHNVFPVKRTNLRISRPTSYVPARQLFTAITVLFPSLVFRHLALISMTILPPFHGEETTRGEIGLVLDFLWARMIGIFFFFF